MLSVKSPEVVRGGSTFREEPGLTGKATRATEVKGVAFPKLLDPVDDLPPTTVVTRVTRLAGGKLRVRGTTADNGTVKRVRVNGKEARAVAANFTEWEIILEKLPVAGRLEASAEDTAGNVEKTPHVLNMTP